MICQEEVSNPSGRRAAKFGEQGSRIDRLEKGESDTHPIPECNVISPAPQILLPAHCLTTRMSPNGDGKVHWDDFTIPEIRAVCGGWCADKVVKSKSGKVYVYKDKVFRWRDPFCRNGKGNRIQRTRYIR